MLHFKCPAEKRTGLPIEIATSLTVLEQKILAVGRYMYSIEIVHTKFCDPRWKIVASATLESWVPKNVFFSKKRKLCRFFGAIIFHLGSWNFVCTMPKHISNHCKKSIALLHSGRWQFMWQFQHSWVSLNFFYRWKLIVKFLLIASVNR